MRRRRSLLSPGHDQRGKRDADTSDGKPTGCKEDSTRARLAQPRLGRRASLAPGTVEVDEVHGEANQGADSQAHEAGPLGDAVLRKDEGHRLEEEVQGAPGKRDPEREAKDDGLRRQEHCAGVIVVVVVNYRLHRLGFRAQAHLAV